MSVAPDDPLSLPRSRRPASLGGLGLDPAWEIDESELGSNLQVRIDRPDHGFIEPMKAMTLLDYRNALASTRQFWKRIM